MERHLSPTPIHRTGPKEDGQWYNSLLCLLRNPWFEIGGVTMALGEVGDGSQIPLPAICRSIGVGRDDAQLRDKTMGFLK